MIQNNSRIENQNGVLFYEQDILYDDHVYTEDIEINFVVDYLSPGFGIALLNNEGMPLKDQKEVFLFKIGQREASIFYKSAIEQKRIRFNSTPIAPPVQQLKMRFTKKGRNLSLFAQDLETPVIEYTMANHWDRFSIGYYSNAGNILKESVIATATPDKWIVNMYNTDGGYVKFFKSGFSLKGCKNNAEFEQIKIPLKATTYYLKCVIEPVDGKCDIVPYVFKHGDTRIDNKEKNLLGERNAFVLTEPCEINLKFVGKWGSVKNILISENQNDQYAPTEGDENIIEGSYIEFNAKEIDMIKWTGIIYDWNDLSPDQMLDKKNESFIISNGVESFKVSDTPVRKDREYSYSYDVNNYQFKIYEGANSVKEFKNKSDVITIFKNMDALISKLSIIKDGVEIDLVTDSVNKKYVPVDITSPIIALDSENVPLDLSSSYRYINKDGYKKYIFTNVEREIFEPETQLVLNSLPSTQLGSVKIYGILKNAEVDPDRFYEIEHESIDKIDCYTPHYEQLFNDKIRQIDYNKGNIYLENLNDKYESIIVDYVKKRSYCINYDIVKKAYEVIFSNDGGDVYLIYDTIEEIDGVVNVNDHRITKITPQSKQYIVLKKEGYRADISRDTSTEDSVES